MMDDKITENILGSHSEETPLDTNESKEKEEYEIKLEWALHHQETERTDTNFKKGCIFCKVEVNGTRADYIHHLSQKHNVQLGKPENLVFVDELLDKIQSSIDRLICIYCEKKFKDRAVLKEHMRKKLHKRINPNNKSYDKYYITNYLDPKSTWRKKHLQKNCDTEEQDLDTINFENNDENDEASWSDWNEEEADIICLFCPSKSQEFGSVLQHMKEEHNFDFEEIISSLDFYLRVKLVNYVRRQMNMSRCIFCNEEVEDVMSHMSTNEHCKLPDVKIWDQPEYYFPVQENDGFLYNLEANNDDNEVEN